MTHATTAIAPGTAIPAIHTGIFADIYEKCLSILPTNFKVAPAYNLPANESILGA